MKNMSAKPKNYFNELAKFLFAENIFLKKY